MPVNEDHEHYLGIMQYVGPSVESGYLDARKSADALIGLDEALRYFIKVYSPDLAEADFEIPVRVRKGSWQALIPQDLGQWFVTGIGVAGSAYLVKAAQKMAENDFRDMSLRQLFLRSLTSIQWAIRIAKQVGTLTRRKFDNVRWRDGTTEVGIVNERGEVLFVPSEFVSVYERMPPAIFARMSSVVKEDRTLEIIVRNGNEEVTEAISEQHKRIFCPEDHDILFPELVHGAPFDGVGSVTRGNGNTNSLGFQYEGHILTCYPKQGSIVRYKHALFLRCRMQGTVTREDKFGNPTEARPRIIFSDLTPLEREAKSEGPFQATLFEEDDQA